MKKVIWIPVAAFLSAVVLISCFKDNDTEQCTPNTLEQDRHVIDSFIMANDLDYMEFNSDFNLYTGVINDGDGVIPNDNDKIAYKYTIKLMNGTTLITSDSIYLSLQGNKLTPADFKSSTPVLEYYFLKNVGKGGTMRVIVPSRIGSDCKNQQLQNGTVIPAYSQLVYDFTLVGVQPATTP